MRNQNQPHIWYGKSGRYVLFAAILACLLSYVLWKTYETARYSFVLANVPYPISGHTPSRVSDQVLLTNATEYNMSKYYK